ncbi:ABC transporter permease [Fulvivirga imtechensis]|uniref:ABC transporter permease n=1 Tax=Fulvivirga imtechensis TaxID=881893 RepID=UPI00058FCDED|nr:ABC transporter permease [Fulvivirga imtechensis]
MIRNLFLISIRNFLKNKGYTILNLIGLVAGLVSFLLISVWVDYEKSVDKFHEKDERLYRVLRNVNHEDGRLESDFVMSKPLADALEADYPEIDQTVLVFWEEEVLFRHEGKLVKDQGFYAGKNFFQVFSFDLIKGDAATALEGMYSIVISESLSNKIFGTVNSLGNTIEIKDYGNFEVTGVSKDVPDNSTLKFDYVIPLEHYVKDNDWVHAWDNYGFKLYATQKEGIAPEVISDKIKGTTKRYQPESKDEIFLQKFSDAYLISDFENGKPSGGRIEQVRLIRAIGLFMLIISGINFINLSTALAIRRAKEVGIRKVMGVTRGFLVMQFLFETSLVVLIAILIANAMAVGLLPYFNQLTETALVINYTNPDFWILVFSLWIIMTLLAGLYPAIILSGFNPVKILKGHSSQSRSNERLRRVLVVIQFSISVILVVGTFVIFKQNNYITSKDLGIEKNNIIQVPIEGEIKQNYNTIKQQLLANSSIKSVTATGQNPLEVTSRISGVNWSGKNPNEEIIFGMITADYDFLETFKIPLKEGRAFSRKFPADSSNFIVNEMAAEIMGFDDIVGESLQFGEENGVVVGVIKDFYNATLYSPIKPLIIRLNPQQTDRVFIRATTSDIQSVLGNVQQVFEAYNSEFPFQYSFLDENFERRYRREQVTSKLIQSFTIVIILISCLGLFSLSTYVAEKRSKEVGIRKVLGASVTSISLLMSGGFVKLVLISYIIAVPVSYYLVDSYLDKFAYRIDIGIDIYLLTAVIALLISVLTTGYQSIRSANINPVKVLRDN